MQNTNIAKTRFFYMTDEYALSMSNGRVTQKDVPTEKDGFMVYHKDGIYSEDIFGVSKFSRRASQTSKQDMDKRSYNCGHIFAPPHIHPSMLNSNNNIEKIIGCETGKALLDLHDRKAYLVVIRHTSKLISMGPAYDAFMKEVDNKKIRELEFDAPWFQKSPYKICLIQASNIVSNIQDSKYLNYDTYVADNDSCILSGAPAIMWLLAQSTLKDDYIYLLQRLESVTTKSTKTDVTELDKEEINNLNKRIAVVKGLLDQGLTKCHLIREVVLVLPAGLRERSKQAKSAGKRNDMYIESDISNIYNEVLDQANAYFSKHLPIIDIDAYFNNPHDLNQFKSIKFSAQNFQPYVNFVQALNKLDNRIVDTMIGKQGRIRKTVLSKRLDFSGGAVLIPEPSLRLDQVGVPVRIILDLYKNELLAIKEFKYNLQKLQSMYTTNAKLNPITILETFLMANNQDFIDNKSIYLREEQTAQNVTITHSLDNFKPSKDPVIELKESFIEIINRVLRQKRTILIRFPSLHRFNEMALVPVISFSPNLKIHPLICEHYNADFDGDQGTVISLDYEESIKEADEIMLPTKNLHGAQGDLMAIPKQDTVLGTYWLTSQDTKTPAHIQKKTTLDEYYDALEQASIKSYLESQGIQQTHLQALQLQVPSHKHFDSFYEMFRDFKSGLLEVNDTVEVDWPHIDESICIQEYYKFKINNKGKRTDLNNIYLSKSSPEDIEMFYEFQPTLPTKPIIARVGQFIMNSMLPQNLQYNLKNNIDPDRQVDQYSLSVTTTVDSKAISKICTVIAENMDTEKTAYHLDTLKEAGYYYATLSGISLSVIDVIAVDKDEDIKEGITYSNEVDKQLDKGLITKDKADEMKIANWMKITSRVNKRAYDLLETDNAIRTMSVSGSRGSMAQVTQMIGMRGIVSDTESKPLPTPITSSIGDGMTNEQFFISTAGSRKGIYDRSNRTRDTGDSARIDGFGLQDQIVTAGDCGDREGTLLTKIEYAGNTKTLAERAIGHYTLEDVIDKQTGLTVCKAGEILEEKHREIIDKNYTQLRVRTSLSCKAAHGICAKCYGFAFINNTYPYIGYAAGSIAAQSVNERNSQLTMRTFHTGGVAGNDIGDTAKAFKTLKQTSALNENLLQFMQDSDKYLVSTGQTKFPSLKARFVDYIQTNNIASIKDYTDCPIAPTFSQLAIADEGNVVNIRGAIRDELTKIYLTSGVDMKEVYFDTYAKGMSALFQIVDAGDSTHTNGEVVTFDEFLKTNIYLANSGQEVMVARQIISNMKQLAVAPHKPMAALMFQDLRRNISKIVSNGVVDPLTDSMSSIAVSNPIPTGKEIAPKIIERRMDLKREFINREEWLNSVKDDKSNMLQQQPSTPTSQPQQPQTQQPTPTPAYTKLTQEEFDAEVQAQEQNLNINTASWGPTQPTYEETNDFSEVIEGHNQHKQDQVQDQTQDTDTEEEHKDEQKELTESKAKWSK